MLLPIGQTVGGTADATGAATIAVPQFSPLLVASVTFNVFTSGSPNLQIVQAAGSQPGQVPLAAAPGSGGVAQLGPVTIPGTLRTLLLISGCDPGAVVNVSITGWEGQPTELPPVSQTYSTVGVQQTDPNQLLTGAVGPPLLENVGGITVPATPTPFLSQIFNIAGYAGVFACLQGPINAHAYAVALNWFDSNGNPTLSTTIADVDYGLGEEPLHYAYAGALGSQVQLSVESAGAGFGNFTAILLLPLAHAPPDASALLSNRSLITVQADTIGTSSSKTYDSVASWPGGAVWTMHAGGTSPNFIARLGGITSAGAFEEIARITDGDSPGSGTIARVELRDWFPRITIQNLSASNPLTFTSSLTASP